MIMLSEDQLTVRKPSLSVRARSYRVAVKTKTNKKAWVYNELRFPSRRSAELYGDDLEKRWSLALTTEVQETDDPSNANYPVPNDRYDVER